jgi:hypothetical protein
MATKCEKRGCEREALNTLTFPDPFHKNVDTEYPVVLCAEHTKEVQQFAEMDVAGVKKWLDTAP